MIQCGYEQLKTFAEQVFLKMGLPASSAADAARVLLSADLRGVDSHGVARLSGYVRLWDAGRIQTNTSPFIEHETPSTAVVDGNAGLGLCVAPYAMQVAIDKAAQVGTGWVSVHNSSHFGIAGVHAMMALPHDMIGIAFTNASPLVAPTFSKDRMLGTNPIAVAIPAGEEPPFVADFATTTAANGKLEILQRKKESAPLGWIQTQEGAPTTDASALKQGGALLPLGGDREHSSHKGFMLGSIVDIFSGVLSGANFGKYVPPFPAYIAMPSFMPGKGIGHFFGAMRIDGFRKAADFKKDMDTWIRDMRAAAPIHPEQTVVIPGDPERTETAHRLQHGIDLMEEVYDDLQQVAQRFSLNL
jgi:LDH2 family malate/lactate/ureidoglycolate dehydrogenase